MKDQLDFRYLTTLYNAGGYFHVSVPTKTEDRAAWLLQWWPHKGITEKRSTRSQRACMVAVRLEGRNQEPVTLWARNSQLAGMLIQEWERKKGRRGEYRDYTVGPQPWKRYTGGWNPPGGLQSVKAERVDIKQILKDPKKRKKLEDMMDAGIKSVPMDRARPVFKLASKEVRCDIKVVNRRDADFTIPIERGTEFGNPFKVSEHGRAEALRLYEVYARKKLMKLIEDIPPWAVLGCVCKPKRCHGDIIVKLWKEIHKEIQVVPHEFSPGTPETPELKKKSKADWDNLL